MSENEAKNTAESQNKQLETRQILFLSYYLDPKSGTFSNALKSAIRAGYSEEYATNITALLPKWLSENVGKHNEGLLEKAENNLNEFLDMETTGMVMARGAKRRTRRDLPHRFYIKADITKFVKERLDPAYAKKQENKNLNLRISLKDIAKKRREAGIPALIPDDL